MGTFNQGDGGSVIAGTVLATDIQGIPATTDLSIVNESPFAGALADGGLLLDNSYTWTDLYALSAAAYDGAVVWVSDWKCQFFSDGASWLPVGYSFLLGSGLGSGVASAGLGTTIATDFVVLQTDVIPIGIMRANCRIEVSVLWRFVGSTAVKTMIEAFGVPAVTNNLTTNAYVAGSNVVLHANTVAAGTLAARNRQVVTVDSISSPGTQLTHTTNFLTGINDSAGATSFLRGDHTVDWTTAVTLSIGFMGNTADTAEVLHRTVEIFYERA